MRNPKFKIGERVRIKSYETMCEEYLLLPDGTIFENDVYFIKEMKYLCGIEAEILGIKQDSDELYISYEIDPEIQKGWMIEEYMLEPAILSNNDTMYDVSYNDFINTIIPN